MTHSPNGPASHKTLTYLAGLGSADSLGADQLSRHNSQRQGLTTTPRNLLDRLRVIGQNLFPGQHRT